jgi:hypothetical protein
MTAEANTEWSHFDLMQGIEQLRKDCRKIRHLATDKLAGIEQVSSLIHTIDFIEYNMKEMEINGGNGDE